MNIMLPAYIVFSTQYYLLFKLSSVLFIIFAFMWEKHLKYQKQKLYEILLTYIAEICILIITKNNFNT